MKFLRIMCVVALLVAVSAIAYAETQSVKVSGDIALRAFARDNYDLNNDDAAPAGNGSESNQWANYLTSTAEVQIDADLTDNVSGVIRLYNQREWGDQNATALATDELGQVRAPYDNAVSTRASAAGANTFDVGVDLAYIELKEFLYSPLTLRIGRQDLWFGRGFIVGANLQDPTGGFWPMEYTAQRSFDAVRATLDYDPWTIDGVYAKIRENYRRSDDDINLWGANVGYVFDEYNAEAEAYWWYKNQRFTGSGFNIAPPATTMTVINGADSNDINTVGARGSFDPIEDWTIALEGAYQFGEYAGVYNRAVAATANQTNRRKRSAWAIDAMIECRYWQDDFAWRPVIGAEYIYYSGEEDIGNEIDQTSGLYHGWDPMYRGKFDTAIREFQNVFYRTAMASTPSNTNQHQILVRGSVEPTDSLTCEALYGHFWLDKRFAENAVMATPETAKKNVGDEVDLKVTWDYTEDVQFSLLCAFFFPGDHFSSGGGNDTATDLVGTVKLSF